MSAKTKPLGICDHCAGPIKPGEWYTSKRQPRRYCSRDCRNTANSRNGNPVRVAKLRESIRKGTWRNPVEIRPPTPDEQAGRARKGRLREVFESRWRNPAIDESAREKLSRARKHSPILHSALEKLRQGLRMNELTQEEREAHRAYRKQLRDQNREEVNRKARERYRKNHEG